MSNWKRISLIIFVLIGGTVAFGYWSINQFNLAFNSLDTSYLASTHEAYSSLKREVNLASTSPQVSEISASSTDMEVSFSFPKKGFNIYSGCTYEIPLQSSTTLASLEASLVDRGTKDLIDTTKSGLAKEIKIESDSSNFKWKVGSVWPGEYYIQTSKINGSDIQTKSEIFLINRMPEDIDVPAQKEICNKSNGIL